MEKIRAKKSLGQNFLIDNNICGKIVDHLSLEATDNVLEIGSGRGALTDILVNYPLNSLEIIEKDDYLRKDLLEKYSQILSAENDALSVDWDKRADKKYKIVANLPYNIASKLIWDIVSSKMNWERCVFMVQYEVAHRLAAKEGSKTYGALSAWVQNFAEVKYLFKVPPHLFFPAPKVDSAVVLFYPKASLALDEKESLRKLLHICFSMRRKQLQKILRQYWTNDIEVWFKNEGLRFEDRPEILSPEQFKKLAFLLKNKILT